MGQKLRKMVMKRKALCDLVVGATRIQGPGVGTSLGEYFSPVLADGETLPDLTATIELYGRKLESYGDAMVAADEQYLAELARFDEVEAEGREPTRKLKGKILSLRSTCEGLFGEETLGPLALDFNLAQDVRGVLRQGEIIRRRVAGSERELTSDRWIEGSLDRETSAQQLDPEIEELRVVVKRLVEQRKQVDIAKVRKDETLEEFDRHYIPIVRVLEATFRVAGKPKLADRIRPTVRQLTRNDDQDQKTEPPAESSEAPSPEASTPESSTESDSQAS